jgi:glycosyltransferase involved in cell wall biosynthesis
VEPTAKATHKPSRAAKSATAREARDHVRKNYGHAGLPTVNILDVLPGIDETVSVGRSSDALAPAAVALVKGLAARIPGSRVLQLETAPRTSIAANVVRTSRECLSIIAEDREPGARARGESLLVERASYDATSGEVSYHSASLDYAGIKRSFDLVVVDGWGARESIHEATEMAFDLLGPGVESAIVWNVRQTDSGQIAWEVLAGILDGAPDDGYDDLYFVPGTSQALWTRRDLLKTRDSIRHGPKDVVDVRYAVRSAPRKLVVLDDGFPSRRSAFRIAEYNNYLERWNDATLYSTTSSFTALGEKKHFSEVLNDYAALYPSLAGRVFKYHRDLDLGGDLAYFVFLNNAMRFLAGIEESGSPFAFTLYPGGGFRLHQKDSDDNLRRVCSSPSFRKVIATQKVTYDYLVDGEFCRPEDVEFVYGGVFPFSDAVSQAVPRRHYKRDKDTFDVCFVAYKYTVRSLKSKGYDVFAEVARQLSKVHEDVRFHVVGTFDETDVDVSEVGDKVRFYGPRTTEFFPAFYANMDAIISPNASFALQPGAFDGFPTGSCMEAGMCGVAVFCSDPLRQNVAFKDGEEMVIIPRDAHEICSSLSYYRENYERLRALADRGQQAFTRVFDIEAQMRPRLRIISELLGGSDAARR